MNNCRRMRYGLSLLLSCTLSCAVLGGLRASGQETAEPENSSPRAPVESVRDAENAEPAVERSDAAEQDGSSELTQTAEQGTAEHDEAAESAAESKETEESDESTERDEADESVEASESDELSESSDVWKSLAPASDTAQGDAAQGDVDPGRLRFDFVAADWRDVLQWFASEARRNLDWREMPEGKLNLTTRGSYDLAEAQDVLNMHLLARGFTLLEREEALFLVKLDDSLNPTMVPRVGADELDERGNYEYVKVSLPLDWMLAEEAARELAPILSPHGRIIPLTATNRIEAMDAVSNLRELRSVLEREQSDGGQERLVAEFHLQHADALEVIEKLNDLLGREKPPERMSRDQMRMARDQMVLQTEMVKRLGDKAPPIQPRGSEVHLVANERRNSILANAPPDKIAIIKQAVTALDVPADDRGVLLTDVTTMKVYPLNGADASAVTSILEDLRDIGKLDTNSRFSEDADRQILFAHASLQDHLTINSVMDQLAGSGRQFEVFPLRQLQAAYVADSIRTLMQGDDAANSDRRNRYRRGRTANNSSGFRVEADLPNNRLFVYATASETEQVEQLLVQLGERSAQLGNQRVISVAPGNVDETIERVRALWPSLSDDSLRIDVPGQRAHSGDSSARDPAERDATESDEAPRAEGRDRRRGEDPRDATKSPRDSTVSVHRQGSVDHQAATSQLPFEPLLGEVSLLVDAGGATPDPAPGSEEPSERRSGRVQIGEGGRDELILSSDDRQALDELESLFWSTRPRAEPYTVFQLRHASPYSIELTLQDIFASDEVRATAPLRFVSDATTRSIMVFGAGESELREIEDMIEFYDQPPASDPESVRKPRFLDLQYAGAEVVAEVIKDLYRDLLSDDNRGRQQPRGGRARAAPNTWVSATAGDGNQLQFRGMLSIGTFADTNTLIVSAPGYLADEIEQTVRELDREEAATLAGTVTSVVRIGGLMNGELIADRLGEMMSAPESPSPRDERQLERDWRRTRSDFQQQRRVPRGGGDNFRRGGRQPGARSAPIPPPRISGGRR